MHCKSLWIKASAKCINVNVNVDDFDNTLTYGQFMNHHGFSVPPKDCNILLKAIPAGLIQVVISHLMFSKSNVIYPAFLLGGINILDRKCNNRHIHKPFQIKRKITPRGKFYWNLFITDIVWKKAWLLPSKVCISKSITKSFIKSNSSFSKYSDFDEN